MPERILTIVNVVLILIGGICIAMVATWRYEKPEEVATMERNLASGRATPIVATPPPPAREKSYANLERPFMKPLYTPTPTPPPPPPAPTRTPSLPDAVQRWEIRSLDPGRAPNPGEALIVDTRDQTMFTLKVGGPPREGRDTRNIPIPVALQSVDQVNLTVTFTGLGQRISKAMKF
jgi:hypothetical protein